MDFNIYTGTSDQEIALMKKTIAKSASAVEQLESEIAVKRGHWHKFGSFTVSDPETFDFGGLKSGFAIVNTKPNIPLSIGNTGYSLYGDNKAVVCVDGMLYLDYSGMQKNSNLANFLAAGGYSSIELECPSGGTAEFDLYILD